MRKLLNIFTFIISLFLISCNFTSGEEIYLTKNDNKKISIIVSSNETTLNFSNHSSERSITPASLTSDKMDFYLYGKNTSNNTIIPYTKVEFKPYENSNSTGIVMLDLLPGIYELTLYACEKGSAVSNETTYFTGKSIVDLYIENEIYFHLSSKGLTSSYGDANFYLYTLGWQVTDEMTVTAGIYELNNENSKLHEIQNFNLKSHHYNSTSELPADYTYNYTPIPLPKGIYSFKVTIKHKGVNFYYTDTLYIEPNRTIKTAIGIPNIIAKIPNGPDYLISQYKEPENPDQILYPVEFCWNDNSDTESNYQLELISLDDYTFNNYTRSMQRLMSTTSTQEEKDEAWNYVKESVSAKSPIDIITIDNTFYDDEEISSNLEGSLTANSNYCVLNLLLGKRYIARICACSSAGNSPYTYLDLSNSQNKSYSSTIDGGIFHQWNNNAKSMNLYRIRYFFDNGKFYDDANNENVSNLIPTLKYYYQTDEGTEILNPINFSYVADKTATLKLSSFNGKIFENWKIGTIYGEIYNPSTKYTDYNNINLFATYEENSTDSKYKLENNNNVLIIKSNTNIKDQIDNTICNQTITLDNFNSCTVSKSELISEGNNYLLFTVRNAYADYSLNTGLGFYNKVFDNVSFSISEQGYSSFIVDEHSFEITQLSSHYNIFVVDISNEDILKTGKTYNILYKCKIENVEYSTTVILNLEE